VPIFVMTMGFSFTAAYLQHVGHETAQSGLVNGKRKATVAGGVPRAVDRLGDLTQTVSH
jgi:hypothetical protein